MISRLILAAGLLAIFPVAVYAQDGASDAGDDGETISWTEHRERPPDPEPEAVPGSSRVLLAPISMDGVDLGDVVPANGYAQVIPPAPTIVARATNAPIGRAFGYSSKLVSTGRLPINSGFGWRRDPISGAGRMHTGVDIDSRYGQSVGAAMGGTVYWAARRGGYGNLVVIDHGQGITTFYAHLSAISVTPGQRVAAGQTVGLVGSTGHSTGPHLHYEVRARGCPVNPASVLAIDGRRIYSDGKLVDGPAIEGGDEAVPTLAGAKGGAAPRPAEPPLFANGDTLSNR